MNHGIINKQHYQNKNHKDRNIYTRYPELDKLYQYFFRTKRRDKYLVAMRYHAIKIIKHIYPEITLKEISGIINVTNHSSIIYYINKYSTIEGHDEFIKSNFKNYIENFLYPLTVKYINKHQHTDELYKAIFISAPKQEAEKPKIIRRYNYKIKRNKKEKNEYFDKERCRTLKDYI